MEITIEETNVRTFEKVTIRKAKVDDLVNAERIAGKEAGLAYAVALVSQVGTFDGEKLPPEELDNLSAEDFLKLSKVLMDSGLKDLAKQLSPSAKK